MTEKITRSDAEWKELLGAEAYHIAREHGTERAWSHAGFPAGDGRFLCAGCGAELFGTATKFESGSGWPSFWAPASESAVETTVDTSFGMRRVEVHCARCDSHLGHVFPDGPNPTGQRYCINGRVLKFDPAT
jgi:peptide-methionine (R)-S-oxide reductase